MGIGCIVHGYIECPGYGWQPGDKRVFRQNRRVIQQLPDSDPEWPFFTKNMFSMLPLRTTLERCIPQYESQVIHFAGVYKNMYKIEGEWLGKFERLLSNLCWLSAVAIAEGSRLRYEWSVDIGRVAEQYQRDPPVPPREWSFQCWEFDLQLVPPAMAIDGKFNSEYHVTPPKSIFDDGPDDWKQSWKRFFHRRKRG